MITEFSVGFLGAGKMAGALAKGFVKAGLISAAKLLASDPSEPARTAFAQETGGATLELNTELVKRSDVVVLAVKPDQAPQVLTEAKTAFSRDKLLVSIVAGLSLKRIGDLLGAEAKAIRVMPNTPALIGASASAYAANSAASPEDVSLAQRLLMSVGLALEVKESLLDAVTGLSGSGPAYGYLIMEALADGGVAAGLPRGIATQLAAQTMLGAARMVLETGLHPGVLKDMVTSPGGTTIDGIHELEKGALRGTLITAVRTAADKSRRLGQT